MTEFALMGMVDDGFDDRLDAERTRRLRATPLRGARDTVAIAPDEFQAELACGCQAGPDEQADGPYEEGFAAYACGVGIAENPYHGDNCAHQQWANGWSQARDEAQRQAR